MREKLFLNIGLLLALQVIISSCAGTVKMQPSVKGEIKIEPPVVKAADILPVAEVPIIVNKPVVDLKSSPAIENKAILKTPDFTLDDLNGKKVSLSNFAGKPVILFIWTTWCPFCRGEILELQNKYKDMKAGGIELLAIDIGESREKVKKFLDKKNIEFPVLLDIDFKVANMYAVIGVPTIILINSQGEIKFQGNSLPDNYVQILSQK